MITETILHLITFLFTPILDLIPVLDTFVIPDNIASYLMSIFKTIGIFIPVSDLMPLFIFSIALTSWRFIYSIICRIRFLFI